VQEHPGNADESDLGVGYLKKPFVLKDGYIDIPQGPGLGIELNEEECLKHPYVEHNLRHYTGALTDIRPPKTEFYF